jgi:hypothetical protein
VLDRDKEVTRASFFRYWFDRRVCAAVVICKDHYEIGLTFQHPSDQCSKARAREIAFGRVLTGKSLALEKEPVHELGIYGALKKRIREAAEKQPAYNYKLVADAMGLPLWFFHRMRKA